MKLISLGGASPATRALKAATALDDFKIRSVQEGAALAVSVPKGDQ